MKPKLKPHATKVANAPLGYSLSVILVWVLVLYGIEPPLEVCMAFTSILSYVVGWFVREGPPEIL